MKTILSMSRCDYGRKIAGWRRRLLTVCLSVIGVIVATKSVYAINHPPFVSWIADQRISSGGFATQYFRVFDYDGLGFGFTRQSSNSTFYPTSSISIQQCGGGDTGCAQDGTG